MPPPFAILAHTGHGPDHYDLLLRQGRALVTWRIGRPPGDLIVGEAMEAIRLADHRTAYLVYEGPVSGGRGEVRRVARGTYEVVERNERCLVVRLRCPAGTWTLAIESVEGAACRLTRRADR